MQEELNKTSTDLHLKNASGEDVIFQIDEIKKITLKKIVQLLEKKDEFFPDGGIEVREEIELERDELIQPILKIFNRLTLSCLQKEDSENILFPSIVESTNNKIENKKFTKKSNDKYTRYFPMYVKYIIEDIENYLLDHDNSNISGSQLETFYKNTIEKFNMILYIFQDKLTPDQFDIVMSMDKGHISNLKNQISSLYNFFGENNPDLLESYKYAMVSQINLKEKKLDDIVDTVNKKMEEHMKERFLALFHEFENWYIFGEDIQLLGNIQKEAVDFLASINMLKEKNICFETAILDNLDDTFSAMDITNKIGHENVEINSKGGLVKIDDFKILIQEGKKGDKEQKSQSLQDFSKKIQDKKTKKQNKIINRNFGNLSDISSVEEITPEFRNSLNYSDRILAFFKYILYEIDGKITYSESIEQKNLDSNETFKSFVKNKYGKNLEDQELENLVNKKINKFSSVLSTMQKYSKMEEFLKNTGDDVELLTDWYVYQLYYGKNIQENTEAVEHTILRKLSEDKGLNNIKFYIDKNESLQNDASLDGDVSLELWKKGLTHFPISLDDDRFSYQDINNDNEQIFFTQKENLYIPDSSSHDSNKLEAFLINGLECCNRIQQYRGLNNDEQKYKKILEKNGIDLKNKQVISQLRIFLKFCINRNKFLSGMFLNSRHVDELIGSTISGKNERNYLETMGFDSDDVKRGESKDYFSAFHKLIGRKNGDLKELTDLSRHLNIFDSFTDAAQGVVNYIKYINSTFDGGIEAVSIEQYTDNFMRKGPKNTGYRDINLLVKLNGEKNPIEVQFHYRNTLKWKQTGIPFKDLLPLYEQNKIEFSQEDINKLSENKYVQKNKLPKDFHNLCAEGVIIPDEIIKKNNGKITADYIYNLSGKNGDSSSDFLQKIQKMEYLPNAFAIGKTRAKEYKKYIKPELDKLHT